MTSKLGLVSEVTRVLVQSSFVRGLGTVLTLHTNHPKQSPETDRQHKTHCADEDTEIQEIERTCSRSQTGKRQSPDSSPIPWN